MQTLAEKTPRVDNLESLTLPELKANLHSSEDGLTNSEAQRRLGQYGYNEIPEKKTNPLLKFFSYFCTQIVATLIAVYGVFMTPTGWSWALAVWGYALAWFVVNDRVKLAAYRILDAGRPSILGGRKQ